MEASTINEKQRKLWQIAGLLSTTNFSDQHPEEALAWLTRHAEELKEGLSIVEQPPEAA